MANCLRSAICTIAISIAATTASLSQSTSTYAGAAQNKGARANNPMRGDSPSERRKELDSISAVIPQSRSRPAQQPKPTIRVVTLGHESHGKSTLTAAITKILYQTGGAKFVPYDDIDNPPEIEVRGIKVAAAQVEYETQKARYIHIDCHRHSDYTKLLTSEEVALDGAILVVSAQDGPILAGKKGVKSIVVYINKVDLADDVELLDLVELETRELLTRYGFNGKEISVIRGSALMALVGKRDDIGKKSVIELLTAMDRHFAENKKERKR
jgi:elongation factor Tu